jgi:hypothetical protein
MSVLLSIRRGVHASTIAARGANSSAMKTAIGLRARSGWATAVVVAEERGAVRVAMRERLVLADDALAGSVQPYHALVPLELREAERKLALFRRSSEALAREAVASLVKRAGGEPRSCGILQSSARPLPDLARILAAHPLVHAAEGEFFRDALREACDHAGLAVVGVKEKEAWERASSELRVPLAALERRVTEMGATVGRPWRADEKLATLAAWLALRSRSR